MTLDEIIEYAVSDDVSWAYHRMMSNAHRKAFDDMLVASGHPLASRPGTTEWRFKTYIKALKGG